MTANVFIPWSDEERELLRQLHENGLSHGDIASTIGRSKNSVSRQIARLGLISNEQGRNTVAKRNFQQTPNAKAKHQRPGPPRAPRTTLPPLPSLLELPKGCEAARRDESKQ